MPDVRLELRAPELPRVIEQLVVRVLDLIDPRDGAPWAARAHVVRALRQWVRAQETAPRRPRPAGPS
jgi:hypothetical protein